MCTRQKYLNFIICLCFTSLVFGATYYVDPNGNDCNDGLSLQTPFQTIQKAADIVNAGDIVLIRGGEYTDSVVIARGGTESNYIIFKAYQNETPVLTCGRIYTGWSQPDANGVYSLVLTRFSAVPDSGLGQLIRKNEYGITQVNSYQELINPIVNPDYADINDVKASDLFYFNPDTNTIYLKARPGADANDIYVVLNGTKRFEVYWTAPYVEISGITVQYGYEGFKVYAPNVKLKNNTIQYIAQQGILSAADNLEVRCNRIISNGRPFAYYQSELINNRYDHSVYLSGDGLVLTDNIMFNCVGGPSIQIGGSDSCSYGATIANNYTDTGLHAAVNQALINNNIILGGAYEYAMGITKATETQVVNNLIKGGKSVTVSIADNPNTGVTDFVFMNNIVIAKDDNYCVIWGESMDMNSAHVDRNYYSRGHRFFLFDPNHNRQWISEFQDYRTLMGTLPPKHEQNSQWTSGGPQGLPLTIKKYTVKAGKTRKTPRDSFTLSGIFDMNQDDIADSNAVYTRMSNASGLVFQGVIPYDSAKLKYGKYSYVRHKGDTANISSASFDLNKKTFRITAAGIDLTGLSSPVDVEFDWGNYLGTDEANEVIINGKQPIPMTLLSGYADALCIDKAYVKASKNADSDSLKITGRIAFASGLEDLTLHPLTLHWGTQDFNLPADSFKALTNGRFKWTRPKGDINPIKSASFDVQKCMFTIVVSDTTIASRNGAVVCGITYDSFDQAVTYSLP
jgi:hypothetical protein